MSFACDPPNGPSGAPDSRRKVIPKELTQADIYAELALPPWMGVRRESTLATVRHRTIRSKGCLSNRTALAMVFKVLEAAQKSWRRLHGHNQLPKLVLV